MGLSCLPNEDAADDDIIADNDEWSGRLVQSSQAEISFISEQHISSSSSFVLAVSIRLD